MRTVRRLMSGIGMALAAVAMYAGPAFAEGGKAGTIDGETVPENKDIMTVEPAFNLVGLPSELQTLIANVDTLSPEDQVRISRVNKSFYEKASHKSIDPEGRIGRSCVVQKPAMRTVYTVTQLKAAMKDKDTLGITVLSNRQQAPIAYLEGDRDADFHVTKKSDYAPPITYSGSMRLIVEGSGDVLVRGQAHVTVKGNATIHLRDYASAEASGHSTVNAFDHSRVEASGRSRINANDESTIKGTESAHIHAFKNAKVEASGNVDVVAEGQAKVVVHGKKVKLHVDRKEQKDVTVEYVK